MRDLTKYIVVAILASIPATYLATAAYLTLLPGSTGLVDSLWPAVMFTAWSMVPAAGIGALVGAVVFGIRRSANSGMAAFLVVVVALLGGALFGWFSTKGTPAIPTPLAIWCAGTAWAIVAAAFAAKRLVRPN